MRRSTNVLALMMLAVSATAGAQVQPVRTMSTDSLAIAIMHVSAGARVRFVMQGGERTLADDPHVENDSMVVKINHHTIAYPLAQVDTLWVMNGRNAGRGAMIVGIPFALVGAILGRSFACDVEPNRSCHDPRNTSAGAALFATILGAPAAAAGAAIGWTIIRWKRIYVRPPNAF